jgi:hypothetical protein
MAESPLVGTWRLESYEVHTPEGEIRYPYGPAPRGYLLYQPDGYMSVAFMTRERRPYASGDRLQGTPAELALAAQGYVSYCGRYTAAADHVVHHIEVSLFPNWIGVDQTRYFTLTGDRLDLWTPPMRMGGADRTARLVWRRAG